MDQTAVYVILCEVEFRRTGNGHFALAAWRVCRRAGLEVPDWILGYLDDVAAAEARLQRQPPADFVRAVGSAFGVSLAKKSRRSPTAADAAAWVIEQWRLGLRQKKGEMVAEAAARFSVSERAVWAEIRRARSSISGYIVPATDR
jgi:hypothetical protein